MSIARWIERHAEFQPNKPALIGPDRTLTYRQFADRISAAARVMATELGVGPGDRIAHYGLNSAELIVMLFAAAKCGAIFVPLNWRLTASELGQVLEDCEVKALVADKHYLETAQTIEIEPDVPRLSLGPNGIGWPDFSDLVDKELASGRTNLEAGLPGSVDEDAPLLIVYTSGTTGRPKGAVLTQKALHYNALNSVHAHHMTSHDHVLSTLPMFHVGGLNIQTTPALYCGATVTIHDRFDPDRVLKAIRDDRPTLTLLVPAMVQALLSHPDWAATDVSSVRAVPVGSTDVPLDLIEGLHARGIPVIQIYGATETGPVTIYQRPEQAYDLAGSIGMPGLHVEVRLVDESGAECADDVEGELHIRAANVMTEYWRKPEETAEVLVDGWYRSGDVAVRRPDGSYWFADRIKNVIISGGENIYPAEIERVFRTIDGIAEVSVVGRPSERWGQEPVAVLVADGEPPSVADIRKHLKANLASYKHPRGLLFVEALPRNVMGKVDLAAVRALVADRAAEVLDPRG